MNTVEKWKIGKQKKLKGSRKEAAGGGGYCGVKVKEIPIALGSVVR